VARYMVKNVADLLLESPCADRKTLICGLELEHKLWERGFRMVAGVDEVGRGPLAGPVVAACVIFPPAVNGRRFTADSLPGVDDSKKLTSAKREGLFDLILTNALDVGIGIVREKDIDRVNILNASLTAMWKAVKKLKNPPDFILVDGNQKIPHLSLPQMSVIKGDSLSLSVAAASIIAKVTRDRIMLKYHKRYPEFCFAENKGYGTKAHIDALKTLGPCKIHRLSFKLVRLCRSNQMDLEMK
jgi:ribonuclease HII